MFQDSNCHDYFLDTIILTQYSAYKNTFCTAESTIPCRLLVHCFALFWRHLGFSADVKSFVVDFTSMWTESELGEVLLSVMEVAWQAFD